MKKSLKSKLVKEVTKDFCLRSVFEFSDSFQEKLQVELNNHLNFKTDVYVEHILNENMNRLTCQVLFEDEESKRRCIDFTIMPKAIEVK